MKIELDVKKLPSRHQERHELTTKRHEASIKAWHKIFPAKIDRGEIPKKMTPALRAFLDKNPDYAAKVENVYVRDMTEAEQIAAVTESRCNLRTIKNPLEKVEIMAVALDARAYDDVSDEGKRSMIVQTIMLRKDGAYINRIAPEDLNEEAVLAAVRRDFAIFAKIEQPTQAMISTAIAQFQKNIHKDVHSASLIYNAVAPHLSSDMREKAEREFILDGYAHAIDFKGGDTAMLEASYGDIEGYFGIHQDEYVRKVAECLYRMANRMKDEVFADDIRVTLKLKYDLNSKGL